MLTVSFARLTDARATVLVLPAALGALAAVADSVNVPRSDGRARVRDSFLLGGALGAAVLVHPVVGALAVATVGLTVLMRPEVAALGVPAIGVAAGLALPQAAAMIGVGAPSIVAVAAVVPALALGWLLSREGVAELVVPLGRAALLGLVLLGMVWADRVVAGAVTGVGELLKTMPLLMVGAVAAFALAPRIAGHPVVLAAIGAGVAVGAATQLVPEGGGMLTDSIRFELPKTLHYWLPVVAALATALGCFVVVLELGGSGFLAVYVAAVVLGDARLRLAEAPAHGYDLILLEAFSSDAIPTHLLTREALALYLSKLADGGAVAFHISNRYVNLLPVVAELARDARVAGVVGRDLRLTDEQQAMLKTTSQWVVVSRHAADLATLSRQPGWVPLPPHGDVGVWTDDFSDILGVIK
jgi:hypothetical protein